jgi:hypothetical protein
MKRFAVALAVLSVSSCNCGHQGLVGIPPDPKTCATDPSLCEVGKPGSISGRVCAGDGSTWLAGATVWVAGAGEDPRITTTSDADGRWKLDNVPAGTVTVHVEKGTFSSARDVVVTSDQTTVIPDDTCQLDVSPRVAVVHGSNYDLVEGVLRELGIKTEKLDVYYSDWADILLADDHGLDGYDILFLNCRSYEPTYMANPQMQARLKAFVQRGGKLHASDQAYDIIEVAFPDEIDFLGDDTVRAAANQGQIADALPAQVLDPSLAMGLGKTTINIHYGLTTWSAMTSVATDVHTYLTADSPLLDGTTLYGAPQIVGFTYGTGHVVYSSFHQEPGIGADQEHILKLLMFEL